MNIFSLSGILIFVFSLSFGFLVLYKGYSKKGNLIWFFFSVSVAMWGLGAYKIGLSSEPENALLWWRIAHIGIIFIPVFFLQYTYIFLGLDSLKQRNLIKLAYLVGIIFLFFDLFTNHFINGVAFMFDSIYYDAPPTLLYIIFVVLWLLGITLAHFKLANYLLKENGRKQQQIKYFFLATLLGFSGGITAFLPVFGIEVYPYFNLMVPLYPAIMAYAIIKYDLLKVKVFAVQLLIGFLVMLSFVSLFTFSSKWEYFIKIFIFVGTIIIVFFLQKSFKMELEQKEELFKLSKELKRANAELKRLDKAKSEFISIASHQLRTPLTAIKGYISLILEGAYGKNAPETEEALNKIFLANERLIQLVEDLLNITHIESGQLEYHIEDVHLEEILKELYDMFTMRAQDKGIDFVLDLPDGQLPVLQADKSKLREVISNLIDNAIKYTNKGFVHVSVKYNKRTLRIIVEDSGVGISETSMKTLFTKFSRGTDSSKVYTEGTGLGLFVGRNLIESQGGHIYAKSDGVDKGSTFIIEMPINKDKK